MFVEKWCIQIDGELGFGNLLSQSSVNSNYPKSWPQAKWWNHIIFKWCSCWGQEMIFLVNIKIPIHTSFSQSWNPSFIRSLSNEHTWNKRQKIFPVWRNPLEWVFFSPQPKGAMHVHVSFRINFILVHRITPLWGPTKIQEKEYGIFFQ